MLSGCWRINTLYRITLPRPTDAIMAAKDQPGKTTKIVWHSCLKCSTRLSELCYDTHTLCETCRNKVCDLTSFCEECESWTPEFRKLYLHNKRTLFLKRVYKKNKKEGISKAKGGNCAPPPPPLRWMMPLVRLLRSPLCLLQWFFCPLINN